MTAHLARKLLELCTYPGCGDPPLPDHCQCSEHRDGHRERNRKWWQKRGNMEASHGDR